MAQETTKDFKTSAWGLETWLSKKQRYMLLQKAEHGSQYPHVITDNCLSMTDNYPVIYHIPYTW